MDVMLLVEACISGTRQPGDLQSAVAAGADVNGFQNGQSPLMRAVLANRGDIATVLLRARADPNMPNNKGVSPLHMAVFDGGYDMIMRLLDGRADPDQVDRVGQTPIFFAPHAQACDQLARNGANPNVFNHKGQSPLHLAAHAGMNESVLWLVQHMTRETINAQDEEGRTAVWCAALANLKPTIAVLQEYGADVQLRPFKITQAKTAATPNKAMNQADMSVLSGASSVPNNALVGQLQPTEVQQRRQWVQDSVMTTPDSRGRKVDFMSSGASQRNESMIGTGQSDSFMLSPKRVVQEYSEHEMDKTLANPNSLRVPQPREGDIYFSPSAKAKGWISSAPLEIHVGQNAYPQPATSAPTVDVFEAQFVNSVPARMTWPHEETEKIPGAPAAPEPVIAAAEPAPEAAPVPEARPQRIQPFAKYYQENVPLAPAGLTAFLTKLHKEFQQGDQQEDRIRSPNAIFRSIDVNQDGIISHEEYQAAYKSGAIEEYMKSVGESHTEPRKNSISQAEIEEAIRKIHNIQRGRLLKRKPSGVLIRTEDFFGATKWEIVLKKHDKKTKFGFWHENAKVDLAREYAKTLYQDGTAPADLNVLSYLERPEALIVKRVVKRGLLEEWNAIHPEAEVKVGDRVVKVNNSTTIMDMQKELRAATCTCTILRFPDVFHVQLDKQGDAKKLGFVSAESVDAQGIEELKVTEISKNGLLDEVNRINMQKGCHHLVVLLDMRIEAVNKFENNRVKMAEELLSSQVVKLRVRRAHIAKQASPSAVGSALATVKQEREPAGTKPEPGTMPELLTSWLCSRGGNIEIDVVKDIVKITIQHPEVAFEKPVAAEQQLKIQDFFVGESLKICGIVGTFSDGEHISWSDGSTWIRCNVEECRTEMSRRRIAVTLQNLPATGQIGPLRDAIEAAKTLEVDPAKIKDAQESLRMITKIWAEASTKAFQHHELDDVPYAKGVRLANSVGDAQKAGVDVQDSEKVLEQFTAWKALRAAIDLEDIVQLRTAITRAEQVDVPEAKIVEARQALARLQLKEAVESREIPKLQAAINDALTAKLPESEVAECKQILAEEEARRDLKEAAESRDLRKLREAIGNAKAAKLPNEEIKECEQILLEEVARHDLKTAATSRKIENLEKALRQARSAGLPEEEMAICKQILAEEQAKGEGPGRRPIEVPASLGSGAPGLYQPPAQRLTQPASPRVSPPVCVAAAAPVCVPAPAPAAPDTSDDVSWKPFHPTCVRPSDYFQVDTWMFLKKDEALVEKLNEQLDGDRDLKLQGGKKKVKKAVRGSKYEVRLDFAGTPFQIDEDADNMIAFEWKGEPAVSSFSCMCQEGAKPGAFDCAALVHLVDSSGDEDFRVPFSITVEMLEELYKRTEEAVQKAFSGKYSVLAFLPEVHVLMRESVRLYRRALRTIRKAEPEAVSRLLSLESKDRYRVKDTAGNAKAPLMLSSREAEALGNVERWEPLHSCTSLEGLMQDALIAHMFLKQVVAPKSAWSYVSCAACKIRTEDEEGLVTWVEEAMCPGTKREARVKQKGEYKYRTQDGTVMWGRVRDVARLALQYESTEKLLMALDALQKIDGLRIVKLENRFHEPTTLGWMDITILAEVDVNADGSHICEIQMQILEFSLAREEAHHHYEKMRVLLPSIGRVDVKDLDKIQQVMLGVFRNNAEEI